MASTYYFKVEEKLNDKYEYHAWKMTLDLTLEEHEVLDYVQGKVVEPTSNAPFSTKTKYIKCEVKENKILVDSIQNHLVSFISDLGTSKEIYDRLGCSK